VPYLFKAVEKEGLQGGSAARLTTVLAGANPAGAIPHLAP
jgi:hypothetical protein